MPAGRIAGSANGSIGQPVDHGQVRNLTEIGDGVRDKSQSVLEGDRRDHPIRCRDGDPSSQQASAQLSESHRTIRVKIQDGDFRQQVLNVSHEPVGLRVLESPGVELRQANRRDRKPS